MREQEPAAGLLRGSLTPLTIAVYLSLHAIWQQVVLGPHSFSILRALFILGVGLVLVARGRTREIKTYFVGRLWPRSGWGALLGLLLVLVAMRVAYQFIFPWVHVAESDFISDAFEAPLNEEVLFRGVFLCILLQYLKPFSAIIMSVLIFLSIHSHLSDARVLISVVLMGSIVGAIYWKSQSVPLCVIAHMLWNLLGNLPLLPHR